MSYVLISPEFVAAPSQDVAGIGSAISAANAQAAASTTQVLAAGAALFGQPAAWPAAPAALAATARRAAAARAATAPTAQPALRATPARMGEPIAREP
jgi:PE family